MFNLKKAIALCSSIIFAASVLAVNTQAATVSYGDANRNGETNLYDLVRIVRHVNALGEDEAFSLQAIDSNYDGEIDAEDVEMLSNVIISKADYSALNPTVSADWNNEW